MRFLRRYKFVLLFLLLLVFCSAMVIVQREQNQSRHKELREAFILLCSKGYNAEAQRLYDRLLRDLQTESIEIIYDDYQRTLLLVDPTSSHSDNFIWRYQATLGKELDQRNKGPLARALKLAEEQGKLP
jgi:hypothetical protein